MLEKNIQAHFNSNLAKATVHQLPFQYLFYENVFPLYFYNNLIDSLPKFPVYDPYAKERPGGNEFPDRFIINLDENMKNIGDAWKIARNVIRNRSTQLTLLNKFKETVSLRINKRAILEPDSILIRDRTNYALNPHTDHPRRVVIMIIYLPKSDKNKHLGTSLYVPKNPSLTCNGLWHHPRSEFTRVFTAPYTPNSAIAFAKTNNSFHGVEAVPEGEERNLIHFFAKAPND